MRLFAPEDCGDAGFIAALRELEADLFVVVAFRLLPRAVFTIPRHGTVNIHASLLPAFRGPAPIQRAIQSGETETGVTVFTIDEGVDTGGILVQKKAPIGPKETAPELYWRLSLIGADALMEALDGIAGGTLLPVPQDSSAASRAPKLAKEESVIDWRSTATAIFNAVRAFKPFPGTCTLLGGKRLGIEWAEPVEASGTQEPGTVMCVSGSFFDVRCSEGALRVLEVKPEGRRAMSVHDFLLGHHLQEGTRFSWTPAD
jgi:methionyl-tRNA formyltransferase